MITVAGFLASASVGCLEKFPSVKSLSGLFEGLLSGALVQFSFFFLEWIFKPLRHVAGYGLTGFELAYHYWYGRLENLAIPFIGSLVPRLNLYMWPFVLYLIPILGGLTIISPFLSLKTSINRVVRVTSGLGLLIICFIFSSNTGNEVLITQGFWFTASAGLFLIVAETLLYTTACIHAFARATR